MSDNYKCDDCERVFPEDELVPARKLSERLTPGGVYTEYECPECGALAYPTDESHRFQRDEG